MKKPVAVVIAEDILPVYRKLIETADEERRNNVTNSKDQQLLKSIEHKIAYLKINPQAGIVIPKDRIPQQYIERYGVTNLWKIDLVDGWRLIYTLKNDEIEILAVILDFYDHPTYDNMFGYRKRCDSMQKITTIIFDLDDTLFDYKTSAQHAMEAVYKEINEKYSISHNALVKEYSKILKGVDIHAFTDGKKSTDYRKERFEKLLIKFNIADSKLVNHLLEIYQTNLSEKTVPYPTSLSVLGQLSKKYTLILATQGPEDSQELAINLLGIRSFFRKVYFSGKTKKRKSDGSLFKHILDDEGLKPFEVIVIGDSFKHDVLGAHTIGIGSVWINKNDEKQNVSFKYQEVKDLDELVAIF